MYYPGDIVRSGSSFGIVITAEKHQCLVLWEDGLKTFSRTNSIRQATLEEITTYSQRITILETMWRDH